MVSCGLLTAAGRILVAIAVVQIEWRLCNCISPPANTPGIEVNFQLTSVTITEGVPLTNFTIIISGGNPMMVLGSTTTVFLTTVDGSAIDGSDYVGISTSVTSLLGTDTINESIVINNDEQNEETEMFSILIYNCTNSLTTCAHGLMNNLEININDDANDLITVEPSMTALTVQEPSQMVVIQMITSNVPANPAPITITYITTNGTATDAMDYTPITNGSITFSQGALILASTQDVTIGIIDDSTFENDETFFVNFTGCSPGCVIPPASNAVTVTIESDEVGVGFQSVPVVVSENDGSATFTLNIGGTVDPGSTTTIYLTAFGGSADMTDYANLANPITSSAGSTIVSGSVDIINDNIMEGTESFSLHIHNCTNTAADCFAVLPYLQITITDDDVSGTGQDPHFIVPLMGNQKFCYSMQGMANFAFNLLSDYFISINAYFVLPEEEKRSRFKEYATFIGDIGILIRLDGHRGKSKVENMTKISISASDHSVSVDGIKTVVNDHSLNIVIDSMSTMVSLDKTVDKKTKPGLTLTVKQPKLSFEVTFVHNHIDLVFIDDSGVSHDCHGVMGQFLHKEATLAKDKLLEINGRFIPIKKLPAWDFVHINDTCLHAKPKHGFQAEGIIEGKYTDYIVESLFSPQFHYNKFKL